MELKDAYTDTENNLLKRLHQLKIDSVYSYLDTYTAVADAIVLTYQFSLLSYTCKWCAFKTFRTMAESKYRIAGIEFKLLTV